MKEREATFRKHLGIPLNRFARIKNYCEELDEDMKYRFSVIPQIDVKVLELLTQVCGKYYSHNITHYCQTSVDNSHNMTHYSVKPQ